jgi:hypothetical protein
MGYVFEKALPPRRPPWPPTGAGGAENPRAESPRPGGPEHRRRKRSTHAHDRSQERRHTCRIVRFRSDLRLPHAALATPQAAFARLVALFHFAPVVARWPGPRASWLHRQRFGQRSVNAQRGPHTSHDNPHRPPVPRPPRRAFAPATAAPPPTHSGRRFSRRPGRSRRVRAVRGPYCVLGDGR